MLALQEPQEPLEPLEPRVLALLGLQVLQALTAQPVLLVLKASLELLGQQARPAMMEPRAPQVLRAQTVPPEQQVLALLAPRALV